MFEYGFVDWAEIYGFTFPFVAFSYIAFFMIAKILSAISKKDLKDIWPNHWLVFGLSTLNGPLLVFFYIKYYAPGRRAFDYLLAGLPQPGVNEFFTWHVLAIGIISVIATLCFLDSVRKDNPAKKGGC